MDLFTPTGREYLLEHYERLAESTYVISEATGNTPYVVRKALLHHGIALRSRSESLKVALANGRRKHPTKGKKRPEDVKNRISHKMVEAWEKVPEEKKEKHREAARENYERLAPRDREELTKKAGEGLRGAAKNGSRLERHVLTWLRARGHSPEWHVEAMVASEKLQIDILLRSLKAAIEIDGPSHYLPIFGEEQLARAQEADARKNGLLLGAGYRVVRVRQTSKHLSRAALTGLCVRLGDALVGPPEVIHLEI